MSVRKVVHVVATSAFAGTERYVANLATAQARSGIEVTVVGGDPEEMRDTLGSALRHEPYRGPLTTLSFLRRMRDVDVAHAHLTIAELLCCVAYPTRRVGIVATRHIAAQRGSSTLGRAAAALIGRRLDGQIAPSKFIANRIDGAAEIIPTGTPSADVGDHGEAVVLVAQRLESEKDTVTAIKAWQSSGLADEGWNMHIAGTGAEEADLRALAKQLSVEGSCLFLGHAADLPSRLARAGVALCTAPEEPFGLTALEAMARATPVVATASGGHLETVGTVDTAALFGPGDFKAAGALMHALALDPSRRCTYGDALRQKQRDEFSLDRFSSRVVDFYQTATADRTARPGVPK